MMSQPLNINFLILNHPITKRQQLGRSSKEQIREILEVPSWLQATAGVTQH
jgi:hypothetical protein